MFLVDITLYTGQHMNCGADTESRALALAHGFCLNTMVELAIVVNVKTGEIVHEMKNAAAQHRIE